MTQSELARLLDSLLAQWEGEVVEFRRAGKGFSTGEIGEYFSALSNEANLACLPHAWLVFGVDNKTRKVVGTDYDGSSESLNKPGGLKYQITQRTDPGVCFNRVHLLEHPNGRVILFEIPAAPKGIPIAWNGHYYARSGENLVALGLDKLEAIRRQGIKEDWSAEIELRIPIIRIKLKREQRMIIDFLVKHPGVSREEINEFMLPEICEDLSEKQKIAKMSNIMTGLRRKGCILNRGTDKSPRWFYIDFREKAE